MKCDRTFEVASCMSCVRYHECKSEHNLVKFYIPVDSHHDFLKGKKVRLYRSSNPWRVPLTVCKEHVLIENGYVVLLVARRVNYCPNCGAQLNHFKCPSCEYTLEIER